MEKEERYNYVFDQYDGDSFIYDLKEDKRIDDLSQCAYILNKYEERFNNLLEIRYKTTPFERFAVVQYYHWNKKPYKIVNCFDAYKDKDMNIVPCYYGCGSTNFKLIKICDTMEEAKKVLEELRK
jgi:hypothetical protein